MFGLVEFRLLWTMHGCMCECVWVWGLLQSFPSGQAEAVLYFFLFSFFSFFLIFFFRQKRKSQTLNPTFDQHSAKSHPLLCESSRALTPRTMPPFWKKKRTGRLGWMDMRGMKGDMGLPYQPVYDISPTPCHYLTSFSWVLHGKVGCCLEGGGTL